MFGQDGRFCKYTTAGSKNDGDTNRTSDISKSESLVLRLNSLQNSIASVKPEDNLFGLTLTTGFGLIITPPLLQIYLISIIWAILVDCLAEYGNVMTACDGCRRCRNGGGTLGRNSGDAFPRLWWRFRESRLSRCVSCPRCGSCRRCPSYAPAGNSKNPERPLCQAVADLFLRGYRSRLRNRQPRLFPLPTMAGHQIVLPNFLPCSG